MVLDEDRTGGKSNVIYRLAFLSQPLTLTTGCRSCNENESTVPTNCLTKLLECFSICSFFIIECLGTNKNRKNFESLYNFFDREVYVFLNYSTTFFLRAICERYRRFNKRWAGTIVF